MCGREDSGLSARFNAAIERAMQERNICYVVWKARRTDEDKTRLILVLNPSLPSRVLWKNLKVVSATEDLLESGPVMFSPDQLNTFYSLNGGADLPNPSISSSISYQSDHFVFCTVSFSVVKQSIRSIKSNAVGLDEIPLKFVKLLLPLIVLPLTHVFNESIMSKTFPTAWKCSKIVPVAMLKDPSRLKDYRPISILPAL
jgi:hypothetical protein